MIFEIAWNSSSLAENNFFKLKTFEIKKIAFNEDFLNLQLDFKISGTWKIFAFTGLLYWEVNVKVKFSQADLFQVGKGEMGGGGRKITIFLMFLLCFITLSSERNE